MGAKRGAKLSKTDALIKLIHICGKSKVTLNSVAECEKIAEALGMEADSVLYDVMGFSREWVAKLKA